MKYFLASSIYVVLLVANGNAMANDRWAAPASRVVTPTVAVRITWLDKNGDQQVSRGTAFLISREGHYITAAHIIPSDVDPKAILIEAELRPFLRSRHGPVSMTVIGTPDRSDLVDTAVLQDVSKSFKAEPLFYSRRIPAPPEELLIFGYAGESGSETNINRVAGEGDNGSIKMHAFVKEGFSGSPVVDLEGRVVGMVRGGEPVAEITSGSGVMGKALFVPVSRIVDKIKTISGIAWTNHSRPVVTFRTQKMCIGSFCTEITVPEILGNIPQAKRETKQPPAEAPGSEEPRPPIRHMRSIDVTKDDHPILLAPSTQQYQPVVVTAFEGYKITDAAFTGYSVNGAKHSVELANDGNSASLHYALTSGPAYDRYRGWIKGDLVITMVPK